MLDKKIYIRRIKAEFPLFEIINSYGLTIAGDYQALLNLRKAGHEIMDVDALLLEMSRNN